MRELKFRVWDPAIPKSIKEAEDGKASGDMVNWDYVKKSSYLIDGLNGKYPMMQYTGLKDKKGKEIYEGDIVRDCYYSDDEEDWHYLGPSGKGVVIWNDDHAGFRIETDRWNKEKISKALPEHTFHQIVSQWLGRIGNIYDNPELREAEQ